MADGIQQVDLVGPRRPVVTPQATEQLAGAFRSGFITADDIMERVSERTRAKEELELVTANQGILDATDPALIQAKKSQQLLAGEQAQQQRDLLPLARRATEEKLFGDIRSGQVARYGIKEKLEALNNVGFAPAPENGITAAFAADVEKRFDMMTGWQTKKGRAVLDLANINAGDIVGPSGATGRGPTDKQTGAPIAEGRVQQLRKDAAETFTEYLFGIPPGATVAPVIQPVPTQTLPVIQPTQPAAIQPAEFPPGFTQVKPAPVEAVVRPTEGQQRALLAVPRFEEANKALQNLQAKGYDPTSWLSWIDSYLPQILKSGDRKEFETAMSVWSQGLLRLESGAAITPKEQGWYEKAFFPVVGDPPTVLRQKEALRRSVEGMVAELGAAGPIGEELKQRTQGVFRAAETFAKGGSTAATPSGTPATPAAAPVFTLTEASAQPAGTIFKDAAGNWRRKL